MSSSTRIVYHAVKGVLRANHNWGIITERSAVLVTACRWKRDYNNSPWGEGLHPQIMIRGGRTFLGDEKIYVTNIGVHGNYPEPGGVEFYVYVEGKEPCDVQVTITVFGDVQDTEFRPGTEPVWLPA